jgi:inner membrane protein
LGACIGEAVAGRQLGRKAMLYGILAQSLPDIDFVTAFYLDKPAELLAHRGFTHSLLFAFMATILASLTAHVVHKRYVPVRHWMRLFGVNIFTHIFIDAFNNYGTAWFEPFSHYRVSFHALYVADPFFSVVPLVASMVLFLSHRKHPRRKWWALVGVGYVAFYLSYAVINKTIVSRDVKAALKNQPVPTKDYIVTPAPLNNWLWYIVAKSDSGVLVGYRSVFDKGDPVQLYYFPRNRALLQSVADKESLHYLERFSQGYYTVEQWGDTTVFNDLRFGQIVGWYNPRERFAFHYYLNYSDKNDLVVQRGRFAKWNETTLKALVNRIRGGK